MKFWNFWKFCNEIQGPQLDFWDFLDFNTNLISVNIFSVFFSLFFSSWIKYIILGTFLGLYVQENTFSWNPDRPDLIRNIFRNFWQHYKKNQCSRIIFHEKFEKSFFSTWAKFGDFLGISFGLANVFFRHILRSCGIKTNTTDKISNRTFFFVILDFFWGFIVNFSIHKRFRN